MPKEAIVFTEEEIRRILVGRVEETRGSGWSCEIHEEGRGTLGVIIEAVCTREAATCPRHAAYALDGEQVRTCQACRALSGPKETR